jgi:hypothetical protein
MSTEELMLNISFAARHDYPAMYVSDEMFERPSIADIAADPLPSKKSFCFRLAPSTNEVGHLESEAPFPIPYIGEASYWDLQFLNLLCTKDRNRFCGCNFLGMEGMVEKVRR